MSRHQAVKAAVVVLVAAIALGAVLVRVLRDDGAAVAARVEVPATPADMGPAGTWVETRVTRAGAVAVREWVRSATPITRLDLITVDPDSLPGTVEARGVVVSTMAGTRLAARRAVGTKSQRVRLREPATELYLSYTIVGETLSGETSTVAGRTLVRVTSMDVAFAGESGPSVRLLRGPGVVLNAACLPVDAGYDVAPDGCGGPAADGAWSVTLRGPERHARVLAQLESTPPADGPTTQPTARPTG